MHEAQHLAAFIARHCSTDQRRLAYTTATPAKARLMQYPVKPAG